MKYFQSCLMIMLFCQISARAQNWLGLLNEDPHIISAGVHANPHLNANADYLFAFEQKEETFQRFGLITQANFPLFSQQGFDFDFRVGAGSLIAFSNPFKALVGLSWNFSRTADLNGRYFHSGFKLDLLPGYYGKKWMFAPHVSLSYQAFMHIHHSDYPQQAFQDLYPNGDGAFNSPKDGWFTQNNPTLQIGLGMTYFQPKWHLNLTAGFQLQPNRLGLIAFPDVGIMPFYGGLNLGYAISSK
jgi:hypothetical protein